MANSLGKVLQEARKRAGMSLRQVEAKTGIKNAHLSQIETDKIDKPEMSMLWDLATLYGLDYERLLRLSGYTTGEKTSGRQRQRMTAALRAMNQLSPQEQQQALSYMAELHRRGKKGA